MEERDMRLLRLAIKLVETAIDSLSDSLYGDVDRNSVYFLKEHLAEKLGVSYEDLS